MEQKTARTRAREKRKRETKVISQLWGLYKEGGKGCVPPPLSFLPLDNCRSIIPTHGQIRNIRYGRCGFIELIFLQRLVHLLFYVDMD